MPATSRVLAIHRRFVPVVFGFAAPWTVPDVPKTLLLFQTRPLLDFTARPSDQNPLLSRLQQ
jgi:hypothetical protein